MGKPELSEDTIRTRLQVIQNGRKCGIPFHKIAAVLGVSTDYCQKFAERHGHKVGYEKPEPRRKAPRSKIAPVQPAPPPNDSAETLSDFDRVKRCLSRASRVPARQISKQTGIPLPIVQEYVKRLGVAA